MGRWVRAIGALVIALPAMAWAQSADIVINHSDAPDPGPAGGLFTYTLRLDNNGPNLAQGVTLEDTLPSGAVYDSVSSSKGGCAAPVGSLVSCAIGDIPFGGSETVTLRVRLPLAGVYTNTVNTSAITPDSNTSNNTNSMQNTTALAAANLWMGATASNLTPAAGESFNYTVTVNNAGPDDVPVGGNTRLTFVVPTGASITGVPTGAGWVCAPASGYPLSTGTITCDRAGQLASGASTSTLTIPAVTNRTGGVTVSFAAAGFKADASAMPDADLADNTATVTVTSASGSDVSISVTASPTTVAMGSNVTYTLTPRHLGGEAPGGTGSGVITVTDTLPPELSFVSATGTGWACAAVGQVVTCTRPGPYTGGNFTNMPTISVVATATAIGVLSNPVTIAIPETDPNPANNAASVNVSSSNDADLRMTKTASINPVVPGQPYTYSLTVRNLGPLAVLAGQTITVTDTLPAGVSLTATPTGSGWTCTPNAGFPIDAASVSCTRSGPLSVNANAPVITVSAVQPAAAGSLMNNACVALGGAGPVDSNLLNDCAGVGVTATGTEGDLEIVSITPSPDPVIAGDNLTYTIVARNNGPSTSTSVRVTDTLSSLVTSGGVQSITTTQGTCTPVTPAAGPSQNMVCELGTLTSGATATITVVVRPTIAVTGSRSNTATITSPDVGDPDHANNTKAVSSVVTAKVDISVTKTVTPATVPAGAPLTYVATVLNTGPSTAQSVQMSEVLPTNASFLNATATGGGSCVTPAVGSTGGTLTCSWASINSGSQQTVTYRVRPLLSAVGANVSSSVNVSTTTLETNLANNTASTSTPVTAAQLDVIINKTDSADPVILGSNTTYTITITNAGPSYATNPVLVDTFPAPASSPTATFSYQGALTVDMGGSCTQPVAGATSGVVRCTFAGLDVGQTATVTYVMRAEALSVLGATSGTAFNRATVTVDEPETQMLNNTIDETTTARRDVIATDVAITMTGPATSLLAGANADYLITVVNNGPVTSIGAQVVNTLPAGVTFISAPGCVFASGTVTCPVGTLATGASISFSLRVQLSVPYTAANPLVNTASVDALGDTVLTNNTATVSTPVGIAVSATAVPTLSEWAMLALAALMALLTPGLMRPRRRL